MAALLQPCEGDSREAWGWRARCVVGVVACAAAESRAGSAQPRVSLEDLLALQAARQLWGPAADIVMISIGTANPQQGQDPVAMPRRGLTLVKPLLDLACAKVASMIKGKTPEDIRKTFNIKNDFTPEEEAAIKEENKWCNDDTNN